jgi:methionine synthase II (cobalamin-independent)
LKVPPIATNVIGSLPLSDSPGNFIRALDDQVEAGLDYVSYPQLADMNQMFLKPLVDGKGIRAEGETFVVNQEFDPRPTKDVRRWAADAREHLRMKKGIIRLKSCVTGPFTLASSLRVEGAEAKPFPQAYLDLMTEDDWVIEKVAKYVRRVCQDYSSTSRMVSIDEPYLSVLVGGRRNLLELGMSRNEAFDLIVETLERAAHGIRTTSSIHVCGRIGRRLSELLLGTSFRVISHEFSEMTDNFDSYGPTDPESNAKLLSVGVVSTKPEDYPGGVEPASLIERRMESAVERYGAGNVVFSPDCGLRPLADLLGEEEGYGLALRKIESLVAARTALATRMGLLTAAEE